MLKGQLTCPHKKKEDYKETQLEGQSPRPIRTIRALEMTCREARHATREKTCIHPHPAHRQCSVIRLGLRRRPLPSRPRLKGATPSRGRVVHARARMSTHDRLPRGRLQPRTPLDASYPRTSSLTATDHSSMHKFMMRAPKEDTTRGMARQPP